MSKKTKKPKKKNRLFLLLLVALTVGLISNVMLLVKEIDYRYWYGSELSSFDASMKRGRYMEMEEMAAQNLAMEYTTVADCSSYEAMGVYYRACLFAGAYEYVGNTAEAENCRKIAEECTAQLEHYAQEKQAKELAEKYLKK